MKLDNPTADLILMCTPIVVAARKRHGPGINGTTRTWRSASACVLDAIDTVLPKDTTRGVVESVYSAFYPFGEKSMHPYKVWLDERKKHLQGRFDPQNTVVRYRRESSDPTPGLFDL